MRWLESGTRRDMCALLYAAGEKRGPALKTALERHYDTRLASRRFYDRLDALVSDGIVARRTEGLDDVYSLTETGERALRQYHAWLTECLEAGEE